MEEEDKCFKCNRTSEEVKLLDAVFHDELAKICEECSLAENIPVIRRPTTSQLKESEKPYTVRERLRRMAGLMPEERQKAVEIARGIGNVTIDDLKKRKKTKEQEIEEQYELAKKRNKPLNLVDNFNWHIFMARRKRKITRNELARLIGESETAIKMIENKEVPGDSDRLINKLEQFLDIKLRKKDEIEDRFLRKSPGISTSSKIISEQKPARILKVNNESVKNLTIEDLQEIKKKKQEEEKLEKQKRLHAEELLHEVDKEEELREKARWKKQVSEDFVGDDVEFED